jgi:hypothetical protein
MLLGMTNLVDRLLPDELSERFYALAMLACSVICFNALQQPPW